MRTSRLIAPVVSTLCLAWCVVMGFVIWSTPMRYVRTSGGVSTTIDRPFSEVSGYGAPPLVIPVVIAGLGSWGAWRDRRVVLGVSALLLAVFTFITGFSIGGAYLLPTGVQLLAAGLAALLGSGRLRPTAA